MRPSDENQAASSQASGRPNLLSSTRRSSNEDNILARIDGAPARRGVAYNAVRLAWYGGAVLMAVALTATLAWLAVDSGAEAPHVSLQSDKRVQQAMADTAPVTPPPNLTTAAPPIETRSALIVDAAPDPIPPLRVLAPSPARAAPPKPPAPAKVRVDPAPASKARAIAARTPARSPARASRNAAPARAREDDSDIAVISAVIFHANGHAAAPGNDEQSSSCADDACNSRAARQ